MGNNRKPGNKNTIKSNLKTSDRISVIYNNQEVEMALEDFNTFLSDNGSPSSAARGYKVYSALIEQSGNGKPTEEKIYTNDTGLTTTWSRTGTGQYKLEFSTLLGYYNHQVFLNVPDSLGDARQLRCEARFDSGDILVDSWRIVEADSLGNPTKTATDSFFNGYIEVRIYD